MEEENMGEEIEIVVPENYRIQQVEDTGNDPARNTQYEGKDAHGDLEIDGFAALVVYKGRFIPFDKP